MLLQCIKSAKSLIEYFEKYFCVFFGRSHYMNNIKLPEITNSEL